MVINAPEVPLPATVVVSRTARPGCEQQLQDWSSTLCQQARRQPGHLRSRVFRRPVDHCGELLLGITFSSPETLATWNGSPGRVQHLEAVTGLTEGTARPLSVDDLAPEEWVLSPTGPPGPGRPSRWLTAFTVWAALYPSALFLGWFLGPVLDSQHLLLRSLVTSAILVPFVLFVGVPICQRLLRPIVRRWT